MVEATLTSRSVLAGEIMAVLQADYPLPISTSEINRRVGGAYGQLTYRLLKRLNRSGSVEKIASPNGHPRLFWRLNPEVTASPLQRYRCGKPGCSVASVGDDDTRACGAHLPEMLGITYRQLDYWVRSGHLRPSESGSGYSRDWPRPELEIARRMGRLIAAGIPLERAAAFARDDWPRGEIAPGITLEVTQ